MTRRRYTRPDAAKFLTEVLGVKTAPSTLSKLFCIGGGPKCRHVGKRPFYDEPDLIEWVESRITEPRRSSSEPRRTRADASPDLPATGAA